MDGDVLLYISAVTVEIQYILNNHTLYRYKNTSNSTHTCMIMVTSAAGGMDTSLRATTLSSTTHTTWGATNTSPYWFFITQDIIEPLGPCPQVNISNLQFDLRPFHNNPFHN